MKLDYIGGRQVQGDRVTWTSHVFLTDPENPDGPPQELMNNSESIVRDGKIVSHIANRAQ